jgi:transcription elongation factor GreA
MMANEKQFPMTKEGKEKLEQELEYLKTVKRKEVVERIKIARGFGDLSENSEYDAAKDEQAFVEARIQTLENMIRNAVIIEEDTENPDVVSLGKSVTFIELPDGEEETYTIVGSYGTNARRRNACQNCCSKIGFKTKHLVENEDEVFFYVEKTSNGYTFYYSNWNFSSYRAACSNSTD